MDMMMMMMMIGRCIKNWRISNLSWDPLQKCIDSLSFSKPSLSLFGSSILSSPPSPPKRTVWKIYTDRWFKKGWHLELWGDTLTLTHTWFILIDISISLLWHPTPLLLNSSLKQAKINTRAHSHSHTCGLNGFKVPKGFNLSICGCVCVW